MKLIDLLEMPVTGMHHFGDFENGGSINEPSDRRAVTAAVKIQKIKQTWADTTHNYNLIFINVTDDQIARTPVLTTLMKSLVEYGKLDAQMWSLLIDQLPDVNDAIDKNAINIIYSNNIGDDRIKLTPWMLAHRASHAFAKKSNIRLNYYIIDVFQDLIHSAYEEIDIFRQIHTGNVYRTFVEHIGTMNSARNKMLTRPGEFSHELVAQYMLTGSIKFNPITIEVVNDLIAKSNIPADEVVTDLRSLVAPANESIEVCRIRLEKMIGEMLDDAVGNIFSI